MVNKAYLTMMTRFNEDNIKYHFPKTSCCVSRVKSTESKEDALNKLYLHA